MTKANNKRKSLGPIHDAIGPYHEEYGLEASRDDWEEMDVATRMNFARVYGKLTLRQAAAAEIAIKVNGWEERPLPPLGVVFLAQAYLDDPKFRRDLSE